MKQEKSEQLKAMILTAVLIALGLSFIAVNVFVINPALDTEQRNIEVCNSLGYSYYYYHLEYMSPIKHICYNTTIDKKIMSDDEWYIETKLYKHGQ